MLHVCLVKKKNIQITQTFFIIINEIHFGNEQNMIKCQGKQEKKRAIANLMSE